MSKSLRSAARCHLVSGRSAPCVQVATQSKLRREHTTEGRSTSAEVCNFQLSKTCSFRLTLTARFSGGAITSNGGAVLLRQADRMLGLTEQAARVLDDPRRKASCRHSARSMLR